MEKCLTCGREALFEIQAERLVHVCSVECALKRGVVDELEVILASAQQDDEAKPQTT